MTDQPHVVRFRVQYCDTDQMKTYYNARVLEWFEFGRSEFLRALGRPYRLWENEGVMLPVREAHIQFVGPAQYDDLLRMTTVLSMPSRARFRFDNHIVHDETDEPVCHGHTVHVVVDSRGRAIRPPDWMTELTKAERDTTE